jgi:hypothetical protein
LKPRYLNQDALENLFGQIRGGCGSGDNPTSFQFVGSLKTQILNGLTNSSLSGTNCETGEHMLLTNFTEFLNVPDTATPNPNFEDLGVAPLASTSTEKEPASIDSEIFKDMAMDALLLGKSGMLSEAYVSGVFVKKILNTITCPQCQNANTDDHNNFITNKEWSNEVTRLIYPSDNVVSFVVNILEEFIPSIGGKSGISKAACETILKSTKCEWYSTAVHKETVINAVINGVSCRATVVG